MFFKYDSSGRTILLLERQTSDVRKIQNGNFNPFAVFGMLVKTLLCFDFVFSWDLFNIIRIHVYNTMVLRQNVINPPPPPPHAPPLLRDIVSRSVVQAHRSMYTRRVHGYCGWRQTYAWHHYAPRNTIDNRCFVRTIITGRYLGELLWSSPLNRVYCTRQRFRVQNVPAVFALIISISTRRTSH